MKSLIDKIVDRFNSSDVIKFSQKDSFSEIKSWCHSGSPTLDYNLHTFGLPTGIIEIAGKSRSGKTTLGLMAMKAFLKETVKRLEPKASVHDVRTVPGPTHTNVIFDCAVPAEYLSDKEHRGAKLLSAIRGEVQKKWADHFCVIHLEPDYAHHMNKEC